MNILSYGQSIEGLIPTIRCTAPEMTILSLAGGTVFRMVEAYGRDGMRFLEQGDRINAVASFGYASGWFRAGVFLGLVIGNLPEGNDILEDAIDPRETQRLQEKIDRYYRLLKEGITALEPAPDGVSTLRKGAEEILIRANSALKEGREHCSGNQILEALRKFGYGHGWLDTGVRTGLFRITGNRELFTI
ncbi:MAG: DUF357 domain-containing protein [Methanomicrobiales archaeon]|nr:DUF357 domain-containing protein [Methanomicrobiales archaeon]